MMADYTALLPRAPEPEQLGDLPALPPFAPESVAFVTALSAALMRSASARAWPELTALGYWMRAANLARIEAGMRQRNGDALLVPRGTALHIAPSNVDTIFVYSWFLSLLAGNRNIVRLSGKSSVQADMLVGAIASLLADPAHEAIARRTLLVRYAPDDSITARLSAVCDVRLIWGGDSTVAQVRRVALPGTATEVAFANKYSLALIDAANWLSADDACRARWVDGFFNDAYWFDQMACSSPRLVLWVGTREMADRAAADFWPRLEARLAQRDQRFGGADYVNKRVSADVLAMDHAVRVAPGQNNDLVRVWLDEPALHIEQHCGAGLFFESHLPALDDLRRLLTRTVQTVSYAGLDPQDMREFVARMPPAGIDRIVPFGRALDFSSVWDGYDLFRVFMREVTVD